MNAPTLPFGKHKDQPLADVPGSYLAWLLKTVRLSSGLRMAVEAELQSRGAEFPVVAVPEVPERACVRCGVQGQMRYVWTQDRLGRKQIRRTCKVCGSWGGNAPQRPPFTTWADENTSPTAALDSLLLADVEGVNLTSDGAEVRFATSEDFKKASPLLRDVLRQQKHLLGSLMGDTRRQPSE